MPNQENDRKSAGSYLLPDFETFFGDRDGYRRSLSTPELSDRIDGIAKSLSSRGVQVEECLVSAFKESRFHFALPLRVRNSDAELSSFLEHSSKFYYLDEYLIRGDDVVIPSSEMSRGRMRDMEIGERLHIERLATFDIDPAKVLIFRMTQPAIEPKPEYYWTTDYFEVIERFGDSSRQNAIALISTLFEVNKNGGLIRDQNDDNGVAVRQIDTKPFLQSSCLGSFAITDYFNPDRIY